MTSIYYRRNYGDIDMPLTFEEEYLGTAEEATYDIMQGWKDGVFIINIEGTFHLLPTKDVAIVVIEAEKPKDYKQKSKLFAVVDNSLCIGYWVSGLDPMETALSIQAGWKSGLMMFRGLNEDSIVCVPTSRIKYIRVEKGITSSLPRPMVTSSLSTPKKPASATRNGYPSVSG